MMASGEKVTVESRKTARTMLKRCIDGGQAMHVQQLVKDRDLAGLEELRRDGVFEFDASNFLYPAMEYFPILSTGSLACIDALGGATKEFRYYLSGHRDVFDPSERVLCKIAKSSFDPELQQWILKVCRQSLDRMQALDTPGDQHARHQFAEARAATLGVIASIACALDEPRLLRDTMAALGGRVVINDRCVNGVLSNGYGLLCSPLAYAVLYDSLEVLDEIDPCWLAQPMGRRVLGESVVGDVGLFDLVQAREGAPDPRFVLALLRLCERAREQLRADDAQWLGKQLMDRLCGGNWNHALDTVMTEALWVFEIDRKTAEYRTHYHALAALERYLAPTLHIPPLEQPGCWFPDDHPVAVLVNRAMTSVGAQADGEGCLAVILQEMEQRGLLEEAMQARWRASAKETLAHRLSQLGWTRSLLYLCEHGQPLDVLDSMKRRLDDWARTYGQDEALQIISSTRAQRVARQAMESFGNDLPSP